MRVLELPRGASPRTWGQLQGESFRGDIAALAAIRTHLCISGFGYERPEQVLAAAEAHLPVLARYDAALSDELLGIAEGAGISPAEVVIVNHYTDLRDLSPDQTRWHDAPESGCSVVFASTPNGPLLGQTWDMHATAMPFVYMLGVPDDGGTTWTLTLTGCLGLAGMNSHRLALAINNLYSTDATLGVVWPAVVRRALRETSATAARDVILRSPIGSGHHYFCADPTRGIGIETSGTLRRVIYDTADDAYRLGQVGAAYCHTNHCLDDVVAKASTISKNSTTHDRFSSLGEALKTDIADIQDLWKRLGTRSGFPRSVDTYMATPQTPHGTATCGVVAFDLLRDESWAAQGFAHLARPDIFRTRA